jgi:hypothetical protein
MSTDSNEVDAEFLAWAKANACGHETMAKALADTERLCRRPRRLLAEYRDAWIRAIVRANKKRWYGIGAHHLARARARACCPRARPGTDARNFRHQHPHCRGKRQPTGGGIFAPSIEKI